MQFRVTRRDSEPHDIAREYAPTVHHIIQGGQRYEMPALEDQLPDAWMPRAFFDYWLGQSGRP
jgi:hypothetical protein